MISSAPNLPSSNAKRSRICASSLSVLSDTEFSIVRCGDCDGEAPHRDSQEHGGDVFATLPSRPFGSADARDMAAGRPAGILPGRQVSRAPGRDGRR